MYKKITLFALLISISGIVLHFYNDINQTLFIVLNQFDYNIIILQEDIFWISGNAWKLLFDIVLFIGAITFYISKEKEIRILRFAFPVLFIGNSYFVLLKLYFIFDSIAKNNLKDNMLDFAVFVWQIFMFYFLYKSIFYLNKLKMINHAIAAFAGTTETSYFKADNWQRLFHFIFDSVIFGIIGFQFLFVFAHLEETESFFRSIEMLFNRQILPAILVIFFGTLFYFVFESLFQATPAKFLTETKVGDKQGFKVPASIIFKRSLSRNIPFDPLSFLVKANWHDAVSKTVVYKEKQTGVSGWYYFILIPISAITVASVHYWEAKIEKDNRYEYANKILKEKNENILESLKTIDTNTVLKLPTNKFNFRNVFLKIENVSYTSIEYSILYVEETGDNLYIEKGYANSKGKIRRGKLKRTDLQRMILADFKQSFDYYEDDKRPFAGISEIPALKGKYIDGVLALNSPNLEVDDLDDPEFDEKKISLKLRNKGIPAQVISITSENKNVNWNVDDFPMEFYKYDPIYLQAEGKDIKSYNVKVVVKDSLNKQFTYEISGTKDKKTAKVILLK